MVQNTIKQFLNKTITAEILLITVTFFWGTTFFLVKSSLEIIPPFAFLSIRFSFASLFVIPIILRQKKKEIVITGDSIIKSVIIGIFLWISFAFQTIGLQYTSSTIAAFITGMNVILTPILAVLLFGSQISKRVIIGATLAFLGLSLLSGIFEINFNNQMNNLQLWGNTSVFICAIAIAFHILSTEKYAPNIDPSYLMSVQVIVAAILSLGISLIVGELKVQYLNPINWNLTIWVTLIITIFFATIFAYFVQSYYQGKKLVTGSRVALIFSFEPIFAALTGYIFLQESLSLLTMFGALLVFIAMILSRPTDDI